MARKKATEEPKEEQAQNLTLSVEDTATDESPGFEESAAGSVDMSANERGADFPEFPPCGGDPFEVASEEAAPSPDSMPMEASGLDEEAPDTSTAALGEDSNAAPTVEDAGEDYTAFLQAMKESGSMETVPPPPEPAPLLLNDIGEADDAGGSPPPMLGEDIPGGDVSDAQEAEPARIEDHRFSPQRGRERILTIDPHAEVQTQEDLDDIVWHEIQNANRTRHILTGTLDSVERTDNGMTVATVRYKGIKVIIPLKEMMVHTGPVPSGPEFSVWVDQVTRILHARQNSDIDFVVRGIDNESRTVVGSRRDAMLRKRKRFYMETDELGNHIIEEGRVVQARVVALASKVIRVEVFGVECTISAKGSSWLWAGNARDEHYVGELILVRVAKIDRPNVEHIHIQVDMRSIYGDAWENLSQCQPQCRYVGQVTDVRRGVVYVRLNNGANAIAHTCYDMRMPGKKDTVSFSVTRLDEKNGIAIGIITRIIKQNL